MRMVCISYYFIVDYYRPIKPIDFRVDSPACVHSYDCPSASEATIKDMD